MTPEIKATWQKVLVHQLQGLMFHQEVSLIYKMFGDCRFEAHRHYKQYINETLNYYQTLEKIIWEYGEIVRPVPASVIPVQIFEPELSVKPLERAERMKDMQIINSKWKTWETSTVKLYEEAIAVIPNCGWLKLLNCSAEKELKNIH